MPPRLLPSRPRTGRTRLAIALALLGGGALGAWPQAAQASGPEARFRLPGGVEMVVAEQPGQGQTGFALAWPVGFADDPPQLPGGAWAFAQGLWHAGDRPLGKALEALGGRGGPEVGPESTWLVGELPSEAAPTFVARLGESLSAAAALGASSPHPSLAATALGALAADAESVARHVGRGLALGPAYGRPAMALPSQWGAWSPFSLAPIARHALIPSGLRFALAGGAAPAKVVGPAVRAFAPLAQAVPPASPAPQPPAPASGWRSPGGKALAVVALPGPGLANAPSEAAALAVAARILSTRLPKELAQVPGQPATTLCAYEAMGRNGAFVVAASCLPGQGVATQEALQDALDALVKGPIGLDEWATALKAEAEGAEVRASSPRGRALALAVGLVQVKRAGWDDAYPAVVRGISRPAVASAVQAYLGTDARRATLLAP